MMKVKTYIDAIKGKGIGVFASEFIPKGTIWWEWDSTLDVLITADKFETYDELTRKFIWKYAVTDKFGNLYLCSDYGRYNNHSDNANTEGIDYKDGVAMRAITTRDIQQGEEMTYDYRTFIYDFPDGELDFEIVQ